MHPQTLRMYEARGLIEPQRSPKGTRLYSQEDVERLTAHPGDDRASSASTSRASSACSAWRRRSRACTRASRRSSCKRCTRRCAWPNELEEVRRSFRAELTVPYRGGLELVRATDVRSPFRLNTDRSTR